MSGLPKRAIEDYEDLIKLLIQLRSPKLSKDFKPTVIYEILNESIPPLSDEELRPLSETIENMDQIKQQLEQLERDRASMKKLTIAYDAYNRFMLAEKANGLVKAAANQDKLSRDMAQLKTDLAHKQQQQTASLLPAWTRSKRCWSRKSGNWNSTMYSGLRSNSRKPKMSWPKRA